jgi:hypothetical protein
MSHGSAPVLAAVAFAAAFCRVSTFSGLVDEFLSATSICSVGDSRCCCTERVHERRAKPRKTLLLVRVPDPHLSFTPDSFQIVRPRPWHTFDVDESMQVRTFSGLPRV